jgi:flagellar motor protein MotB
MTPPTLRTVAAALLCGASFLAVGCQNKMHDENLALHEQNRKLQADLNDRSSALTDAQGRLAQAPDPNSVAAMQARIADLEKQLQAAPPVTPGQVASPADPELAGIEATYDKSRGTLTVNLPGEVLFEPGKSALKASANHTLDKVASAIKKDYAGKTIFVDGHTDSDPITRTKNTWEDNWDLSAARANAVRKYLTSHGVDSKKVNLRAFGPNSPKGSNKAASRRVEIVVQVG